MPSVTSGSSFHCQDTRLWSEAKEQSQSYSMVDAYLQQKDGDHWRSLWGTATTNGAGMWPLLRMQFALPGFSFSHNLCASPLAGAFFCFQDMAAFLAQPS